MKVFCTNESVWNKCLLVTPRWRLEIRIEEWILPAQLEEQSDRPSQLYRLQNNHCSRISTAIDWRNWNAWYPYLHPCFYNQGWMNSFYHNLNLQNNCGNMFWQYLPLTLNLPFLVPMKEHPTRAHEAPRRWTTPDPAKSKK